MKIKTINKIIKLHLSNWINSIDDEKLRNDLRDNIVLSGGSITSMLLQEKVNDYDIYIKDVNVCERLAVYYVGQENVYNGNKKEQYIEEEFPHVSDKLVEAMDELEQKEYASARYVFFKNLKPGQIKLDCNTAGTAVKPPENEKLKEKGFYPTFYSSNAISLSNDIQIVTRFTGTAEEIHKTYDFIHATNYWTFEDGLVLNNDALVSIMTKELRYQGSLYPITSLIRIKKFVQRNWTINAGEILKMAYQCSKLDLDDPFVMEDQLIGVDIAYFGNVIKYLKNQDKDYDFKILSDAINKAFNE